MPRIQATDDFVQEMILRPVGLHAVEGEEQHRRGLSIPFDPLEDSGKLTIQFLID
jgi:hypothetical protein